MKALFRNPLLRLVWRLWWLPPLLFTLIGLIVGGAAGQTLFLNGTAFCLLLPVGMMLFAWLHGLAKMILTGRERWRRQWRFLCPHCLKFGGFYYACGNCEQPLEPFAALTEGLYVNDCSKCKKALFSRFRRTGSGVMARCEHCGKTCSRETHHRRKARVVATLIPQDFQHISSTLRLPERRANDVRYLLLDDGEFLTCLMNIHRFSIILPTWNSRHAIRSLSAIWLSGANMDSRSAALAIGQAVNEWMLYVREMRASERWWRNLPMCVGPSDLDAAADHVLTSDFKNIEYGVSLQAFLEMGSAQADGNMSAPGSFGSLVESLRKQEAEGETLPQKR
jgi:hypothetical protein